MGGVLCRRAAARSTGHGMDPVTRFERRTAIEEAEGRHCEAYIGPAAGSQARGGDGLRNVDACLLAGQA